MSIQLKVRPEALRSKAGEIEGEIKVLENCFNNIQDIVARSMGYWTGTAGDKARREFNAQKDNTNLVIRRFREHPPELLTMAGIYTETEKANAAEDKSLATDVIA